MSNNCCNCCSAFKPRYKRLVDNIFPVDPQDGLIKNNMEKLVFYALSSPEKLDRIGSYLAQRLSRDVSRHRIGFVFVSMEALDQLLLTCHAQSLNLFVESFLKMVSKLLESHDLELQILGTASFVKFSNIEEDTPSYHRRYDFFISKFSSMCHCNSHDIEVRRSTRTSGIRGIQGVVRKTVSDDLQVNIWDQTHMEKIIPSLLFNLQDSPLTSEPSLAEMGPIEEVRSNEGPADDDEPYKLAETVLRDLVCRAAFGSIKSVLKPVLSHLDNHSLWDPNRFAAQTFKIIMYSINAQYSYVAITMLLNHLDTHSQSEARVKAGIVDVLAETAVITASGSIGPQVLELFNTLLRHLRKSIDYQLTGQTMLDESANEVSYNERDERLNQNSLIKTMGVFASLLPDYQKMEVMMFLMSKLPLPKISYLTYQSDSFFLSEGDALLLKMLLKNLLEVGTKYTTISMATSFPATFRGPLFRLSLSSDPTIRSLVQQTLHTLIDRHDNCTHLLEARLIRDISDSPIRFETCSRQDISFAKRHGGQFYTHLYENLLMTNNIPANYLHIYCTLGLVALELGTDDMLIESIRMMIRVQDDACNLGQPLPFTHRYAMHAVCASYLYLISQMNTSIPSFYQHIAQVIETRRNQATYLLPEQALRSLATGTGVPVIECLDMKLLFNINMICEAFASTGHDVSKLAVPFQVKTSELQLLQRRTTSMDVSAISVDIESLHSSPGSERCNARETITFESLEKTLEPDDAQGMLVREEN